MTFQRLHPADKIFVAGHKGLVGSAISAELRQRGYQNILERDRGALDLLDCRGVEEFFRQQRPSVVFVAAAKVGGIVANNIQRTEFLVENLQIQNNVILSAHKYDCRMVVFLGSSCVYPRDCLQPMREQYLLTGPLEFTNRPYALAKISGLELINALNVQYGRRYFSVMPTNLYGPNDGFHPENSHVLPGLIRRFHQAKLAGAPTVVVWGSGTPKREFLYSQDCAAAIVHLAESLKEDFFAQCTKSRDKFFHVNAGSGVEVSIAELAAIVARVVGFEGGIEFDRSRPDGTPRKLLDSGLLFGTGWKPRIGLEVGIGQAYDWFKKNFKA